MTHQGMIEKYYDTSQNSVCFWIYWLKSLLSIRRKNKINTKPESKKP